MNKKWFKKGIPNSSRGAALVEFALTFPIFLMITLIGIQVIWLSYVDVRLQFATDLGARFASLLNGANRALATEQLINRNLWGIPGATMEFCPMANLTPSGGCPGSAGANRDPGAANEYVHFKTTKTVDIFFWPQSIELSAERVVRNEPF